MRTITRQELLDVADQRLSAEDAKDVVFGLEWAQWDNLAGTTKRAKLRALIETAERQSKMDTLLAAVRRVNPSALQGIALAPPSPPVPEPRPIINRYAVYVAGAAGIILVALFALIRPDRYFPVGSTATATDSAPTATMVSLTTTTPVSAASQPATPACPVLRQEVIANLSDMQLVTGTTFIMGSNDFGPRRVFAPASEVSLSSFEIDRYEVTNLDYARFVSVTHRRPPDSWQDGQVPVGQLYHPVNDVTWFDAQAYCQWNGKRLPTEAEWELACRGIDQRLYPWGNAIDPNRINTNANVCGETMPVGSYSPQDESPYGVSDMAGNVIEWVSSAFKRYPYFSNDGREDPNPQVEERMIRGGYWDPNSQQNVCISRISHKADDSLSALGFRCARSIMSP